MMQPATLHPSPRWWEVLLVQLRAVGFGIRRAAMTTGLAGVAMTAFLVLESARYGEGIGADPEWVYLLFFAAPLLPVAVWKEEYDFRHSYLSSLPVRRSHHVLAKITAGWIWLMVAAGALLLWMLSLAAVTGGSIGIDEMRIAAGDLPPGTPAEEVSAFARRWRTPLWQWAVLFTGPTTTYLFGTAIVLAGSATRRWLAGSAVVTFFLIVFSNEQILAGSTADWVERVLTAILLGRFGLMSMLATVDAHPLQTASGEEITVYSAPPTFEVWSVATLLWLGLAVAAVLLVIWRGRRN